MRSKTTSLRRVRDAESCRRSLPTDGPCHAASGALEQPPVRLIFKRELLKRVPLSFPTIWKLMRENRFPRARIIGGKSAWLESEIEQFLAALPLRPYKDDPPQAQTRAELRAAEQKASDVPRRVR